MAMFLVVVVTVVQVVLSWVQYTWDELEATGSLQAQCSSSCTYYNAAIHCSLHVETYSLNLITNKDIHMLGQIISAVAPSLISGLFGGAGANAAASLILVAQRSISTTTRCCLSKAYEGGQYKPYGVSSGLGNFFF